LRASAKQWTVVITLSFMLGGVWTTTGQFATGQTLQTNEESTQAVSSDPAAPGKLPVARLMMGNESSSQTTAAQQVMLAARRALAAGDIPAVKTQLTKLESMRVEPGSRDSSESIKSMVGRHEQLMTLAQQGDATDYNSQAASFLLEQADSLLGYGDWKTAENLAQMADAFGSDFQGKPLSPQAILAKIAAAKTATPEMMSQQRDEAVRLMSQLKLSMDQGRLTEAQQIMAQLKTLNVTDSMLATQDSRPWQLELQLQSMVQNQQATTLAQADESSSMVRTAEFQPGNDQSKVVQASVDTIPSLQYDESKDGIELYLRGVQALNSGNREVAQEMFSKAWEQRDKLDGAVRTALEQKITFLRNSIPATPASARTIIAQDEVASAPDLDTQSQVMLQKMQQHVIRQRAAADKLMEQQKPRNAVNVLQTLRAEIEQSDVDSAPKTQLLAMVDREVDRLNQYIQQHSVEIATAEANSARMQDVMQDRETRYATEGKIQMLVEQYNQLQAEQRFAEANIIARQAAELDPTNVAVVSMVEKSKFAERVYEQDLIAAAKEESFYAGMTAVDSAAIINNESTPMEFGPSRDWQSISATRRDWLAEQNIGDPGEFRIRQILRNHKVQLNFQGTPFSQAMDLLGQEAGVNIAYDAQGMQSENVDTATPVSLTLHTPISLQSALQLILSNFNLTYVIEDEVIKITSRSNATPKLVRRTEYVGDLVHPIPNFQGINPVTIMSAGGIVTSGGMGGQIGNNGQMIGALGASSGPDQTMINPTVMAQQLDPTIGGNYSRSGMQTPTVDPMTGAGGGVQADFQSLIQLIQSTVEPLSWEDNGGPTGATITEFRNTNSLVIRNTQEVHDQIQNLLKRLRELQDVQIVIETRFISLSDSFFERIGVDFDFQINDYSGLDITNFGDERSQSALVGRLGTPDLTLPADLDIPFTQDSFSESVPQFGGFGGGATAANFGFAILSDIEVFFLIQAAKGDQRSNVMTAPKITLFNGQFGSVSDVTTRNFVTSVTPVVGSFAAAHAPVISTLAEGTMMSVQAVVSHDRRFVRLTLVPTFTKLKGVDEFTFSGSSSTNTGSNIFDPTDGSVLTNNTEVTNTGVTVQQPIFSITQVSATVAVPDGGTVLLGGVKRLSEARVERGVPFLSNLPYINRLFKNVGIGRDTSSLMLMVTPRVIIKEEEEARQVGITP